MNNNLCLLFFLIHSTTSSVELIFPTIDNSSSGSDGFEILEKVQGNILCRSCGNDVTSSNDLISKLSLNSLHSYEDSIFDKDDVLIQVFLGNFILNYPVIIAKSSNCIAIQEWEESDWFPGYRWKPCVCPDCGDYLGWVFELIDSDSADSDFVETSSTFFGLIISSLIGESCKYILFSCQFSDCDSWRFAQVNMSTTDTLSAEDKKFLASCEEEFQDRYTEKDKEFMKVFNSEPSIPPIIESWWVSQNSGRRNDRRHNRRNHPYERNNREYDRGDRGEKRGYNDYNDDDRGQNYRNHRPRYY